MKLLKTVTDTISRHQLIESGDAILLAVSGGLDSVALLDLFFQLREEFDLKLGIGHVHHGLRGDEADADMQFVNELAAQYRLPFFSEKVQTAHNRKFSLEEAARVLRYQTFEKFLQRTEYTKVALAHTANDQAETVLDHVLRGSGALGLSGMPMRRDAFIRPLLQITRDELREYVDERRLHYRVDSSNRDLQYRRNRIRLELMPYLEAHFNENLLATLNRMAAIFSENEAFLRREGEEAFQRVLLLHRKNQIVLEINGFLKYFNILRKYVLFSVLEKLGLPRKHVNFQQLENILSQVERKKIGTRLQIKEDFEMLIDHDGLVVQPSRRESPPPQKMDLIANEAFSFGDFDLLWTIFEHHGEIVFDEDSSTAFLDFEKTGEEVCLRTYRPGDRFIPLNFRGHKKIADFFSDRKVPHRLREITPILESSHGIAWVCGHCIDDRFKITEDTHKVLKLQIRYSENDE